MQIWPKSGNISQLDIFKAAFMAKCIDSNLGMILENKMKQIRLSQSMAASWWAGSRVYLTFGYVHATKSPGIYDSGQ
jgi:hypothetical protein